MRTCSASPVWKAVCSQDHSFSLRATTQRRSEQDLPRQSAGIETLTGSAPLRRGQIQRPALASGGGTTLGSPASSCERYMAEPAADHKFQFHQSSVFVALSLSRQTQRMTYIIQSGYCDPDASHTHRHPRQPRRRSLSMAGNNARASPCCIASWRSGRLSRRSSKKLARRLGHAMFRFSQYDSSMVPGRQNMSEGDLPKPSQALATSLPTSKMNLPNLRSSDNNHKRSATLYITT